MLKRSGEEPSQPAFESRRVPAAPASTRRPPLPERPTSASKSLKDLGLSSRPAEVRTRKPEIPSSRVLVVASGSNAAGGGVTPQLENQGTALTFDPPWPLGPMRVKSQATQSGDSLGSRQNIGVAYAQYLTDKSINAKASSRWLDLQNCAKRMLRTLTRSEKQGINQVIIDRINSQLAEVIDRLGCFCATLFFCRL